MGSNNNANTPAPQPQNQNQPSQWSPTTGYGPNANPSGSDPKGVGQNQSQYQQSRYENQQGPLANQAAYNYGQASTQNMGDYNNIQGGYSSFLGGNNPQASYGGGGGQQSGGGGQSSGASSGPPQIQGVSHDPATVQQFLQWQAQQPGSDPILQTPEGINYYTTQILSKPDGLSNQNMGYWQNKSTLGSYGGAVGVPEGGGGNTLQSFQQMNPQGIAAMNSAISGYQGMANTGGYSADDIANLRARGTAPITAAYQTAQDNIDRQRSLQGGYAPNAIAAQSQMARNQGQAMSDAMQNVNAGIVNQRNQNQLAGMAGLSGTGSGLGNLGYNYSQLGQQGVLGALQGQTSLYGATPGMANTFGNQAINITGQGGSFGNNLYANDINNQRNPGMIQNGLNIAGNIGNTASGIANAFLPNGQNNQGGNPTFSGNPDPMTSNGYGDTGGGYDQYGNYIGPGGYDPGANYPSYTGGS